MNPTEKPPRWEQRLASFGRALNLLREFVENDDDLSALEPIVKEGVIQRFEYTFELAWKTLKDKMEYDGIVFDLVSPRAVLKAAYQGKYIDQIELWFRMVNDRNLMSHTYNAHVFDKVLASVQSDYCALLGDLYASFIESSLQS